MINSYRFVFNLTPVAQARPRATRFGKGIRLYDPKTVKAYKSQLAMLASAKFKRQPLSDKPLRIELDIYRPIQKSTTKAKYRLKLLKRLLPTVKPDLDNYVKSTLDALTDVLWGDDNIICELVARKFYGDPARVELTITELEKEGG